MARIGILTLYATGHINPSLALAKALQQRGHEPVFFNLPDIEATVTKAGILFVTYGEQAYPAGSLASTMQKSAELSGPAAFAHYVERMVLFFRAGFQELPALLKQQNVDLLIVDQVMYSGATLAQHLGLPFVTLANALLVNREDVIPPPVLPWPYSTDPAAIARNRQGWAGVDQAYAPLLAMVNEQRTAWDLPPYTNLLEDSFSPIAQLAQQPPAFDFPRLQAPAALHLIGHLKDEQREAQDVPFDWDWLDGRPLIYASCGTLQNRLEHVFRAFIDACAPLNAQTVIALGRNGLSPDLFTPLPDNIKLLTFVPQHALLSRAALCITHAGLNTTLDCLELGVPMVAVPLASEQPGNAMRIAHHGFGKAIALPDLTAESLRSAVQQVLEMPSFRRAAQNAAKQISALNPAAEAVRIIDSVLTHA